MEYITSPEFHLTDTAVALGKFEGLHRGHQLLFDEINRQKKENKKSVVFTFDVPPRSALSGDRGYHQIYTKEERRYFLEKKGIDVLIEHPFTKAFAALSPEAFVRDVLVGKAGAKAVVVGTDFHFGKNRSGSVEVLDALSEKYDYRLIVIEKLTHNGYDISSSRIQELLRAGQMEEAGLLLGTPYTILGKVVHGKALGRTIQIPTANLTADPNKLIPPNGVYVSRVRVDGASYYGVTNIGVKPTVEPGLTEVGVETNLFDFDREIYGKEIAVELLHYHRPEMKFESIALLREQMEKDIAFAKRYAAGREDET